MALKYIYLTNSLGGVSGGPSYVNNKKQWQESKGWKVYAFDGYENDYSPIVFQGLKEYNKNRIKELRFHPSWMCEKQKKIVFKILSHIDYKETDTVIIESNTPVMAEWGEILAKYIKGKHLIYLIGENVLISDRETYEFFFFKYKRNEIFSINEIAFRNLFINYYTIEDASSHYWNAKSICKAEDINTDVFNNLPLHDFVITHFGRWKTYFPKCLAEIIKFADNHRDKSILLLIVGDGFDKKRLGNYYMGRNVKVLFYKPLFPIPQKLFDVSDVVIATAGCAMISFYAGCKTISMDVVNHIPLGVLGYTTKEISFQDSSDMTQLELANELENVLIKDTYKSNPLFDPFDEPCGYDYQMSFVESHDCCYYEGPYSVKAFSFKQTVCQLFIKYLRNVNIALYIDCYFRK